MISKIFLCKCKKSTRPASSGDAAKQPTASSTAPSTGLPSNGESSQAPHKKTVVQPAAPWCATAGKVTITANSTARNASSRVSGNPHRFSATFANSATPANLSNSQKNAYRLARGIVSIHAPP
ncbi:hypothetical protein A3C37_04765 [Candidatus Peribacteria bacterium RIFCSPHIGHO2_02_FULL_53_20]|nr:MAG: hypothetical protein A3C37_04765 [Candidatus Peribacteria bacterium RIFCSPHIGHO2_02_FULL_53_20]OGJ67093.1 MAG: hypothetical protein A3B61_05015 [Candidatus Peribacteria bacterium RIFCSPLOWO2_01_FULL_53_10]OGJ70718.1 MAG: hypothetical protein A3G69_02430 [Candidatus Peribacteria bacterium RIFCSPLOWO2_12_FULL_53_10]